MIQLFHQFNAHKFPLSDLLAQGQLKALARAQLGEAQAGALQAYSIAYYETPSSSTRGFHNFTQLQCF
jgi:hypothetical protein